MASSSSEVLSSKSYQAASCVAALAASRIILALVETENNAKLELILEKNMHSFTLYLSLCMNFLFVVH